MPEIKKFVPDDHLEKSLYNAVMVLVATFDKTRDKKIQAELQEMNAALCNYHNTSECGGGVDHDWQFVEACLTCGAPDQDCQNWDTIWCPTCLGCVEAP